jgi:hypothetical protein
MVIYDINRSTIVEGDMTSEQLEILRDKFPYLTVINYLNKEYIGIMQNSDHLFVSLYILDENFTKDVKKQFLDLGYEWWTESNRTIPINLFLRERFKFKSCLKTFARKETVIVEGPVISMLDLINKKLKKRTVQLGKTD